MIIKLMNSQTSVSRILVPAILAIFLVSSLVDTFSQESFAFNSTLQLSSYNIDDNYSLDKKKKSCTFINILLSREPPHIRSHVSMLHPSLIISHIIFPYFLRAPPLTWCNTHSIIERS
jgi:hypothetical protein